MPGTRIPVMVMVNEWVSRRLIGGRMEHEVHEDMRCSDFPPSGERVVTALPSGSV